MRWISSFLAVAIMSMSSQDSAAEIPVVLMANTEVLGERCGYAAQMGKALKIAESAGMEVTFLQYATSLGADEFQLKILRLKWTAGELEAMRAGYTSNVTFDSGGMSRAKAERLEAELRSTATAGVDMCLSLGRPN